MNLLTVTLLARCQQVRIAAATNRPRLDAEHPAEGEVACADSASGHTHDPVDAPNLIVASVPGFMKELHEHILVRHHRPGSFLAVNGVHR